MSSTTGGGRGAAAGGSFREIFSCRLQFSDLAGLNRGGARELDPSSRRDRSARGAAPVGRRHRARRPRPRRGPPARRVAGCGDDAGRGRRRARFPTPSFGVAYSLRLQATGGSAPYAWSSPSGLPLGLSLSAAGVLAGTPTVAGQASVTIAVTEAGGTRASVVLGLNVDPAVAITTPTLPDPVAGAPYSASLSVSGGEAPFTWSVASGALPLGLVLNSGGLLSGLPASPSTTVTTILVTDRAGGHVTEALTMSVDPSAGLAESYLLASSSGAVSAFAGAGVAVPETGGGDPPSVAGIARRAGGSGYWIVSSSGMVTASPGTPAYGSVGAKRLAGRIVGIAAAPDGRGYWLASSGGEVYGFGSARAGAPVPRKRLVGRIVGIAANDGRGGYWLVSSTGRVYGFGGARPERGHLRGRPTGVVGIAAAPGANGYWLVSAAGRVYPFGAAPVLGSIPAGRHLRSVVGLAATPDGVGYWIALRSGVVVPLGSAAPVGAVEIGSGGHTVAIASLS